MKKHCEVCDFETTYNKDDECVVCLELDKEEWLRVAKLVKGSIEPIVPFKSGGTGWGGR